MTATPTAATPEELAAIRERANAATEGPWLYRPHKMDDWGTVRISDAEEPYFVARAQAGGPTDHAAHRAAGTDPYERNGLFIAHARTDVPRLLDLIEALRAENERLTKERDEAHQRGYDARQAEIVRALEEAGGRIMLVHGPADAGMVTLINERAETAEARATTAEAALAASLERERGMREALRKCISPYAGYAIQSDSQAVQVMKDFYAHIREVDSIARAALAKEATDGR
ncbi:hypothetical protein ACHMW5_13385 [Azospirillum melinis]|uniref:hypothetical protein n=1 Tax=Azospirillum melinis TaxID=328839 RepID=UPI003756BF2E